MNTQTLNQILEVLTNCIPEDPQACEAAIQAVRVAIADAALDKKADNARELGLDYMEGSAEQYEKALEQPAQQEPVAWVLEWTFNGEEVDRRLYDDETHCKFDAGQDGGVCRPLVYGDTTPPAPAQPWVGLTVTEQNELCRKTGASRHQVRSVEAKLKEKNT